MQRRGPDIRGRAPLVHPDQPVLNVSRRDTQGKFLANSLQFLAGQGWKLKARTMEVTGSGPQESKGLNRTEEMAMGCVCVYIGERLWDTQRGRWSATPAGSRPPLCKGEEKRKA